MAKKKDVITWTPKKVLKKDVVSTPNNYKIKTDIGMERFQKSKELFGLAGTLVANPISEGVTEAGGVWYKKKVILVDGNTRKDDSKEDWLWVSLPSRKLSPKEFEEMAAMFDFAKAGEVDTNRIMGELGKTVDFFEKWGMDIPMEMLAGIGSKNGVGNGVNSKGGGSVNGEAGGKGNKKGSDLKESAPDNVCMVNLFFSLNDHKKFLLMVEKAEKLFKLDDVTDVVFRVLKEVTKTK